MRLRRETDIIFLGRGVSARLHLRLSDEQRLAEHGLPVMHTPADVAAKLGLPIKTLRWLAFHTDVATRTHYVRFEVPKRSGGMRVLSAPHKTAEDRAALDPRRTSSLECRLPTPRTDLFRGEVLPPTLVLTLEELSC